MTPHRPEDVFWRSSRRRSENLLGRSWIILLVTSLGDQIMTSHGCHFGMSPGWSNRIFRRSPRDFLATTICWMGISCITWIEEYSAVIRQFCSPIKRMFWIIMSIIKLKNKQYLQVLILRWIICDLCYVGINGRSWGQ